METTPLVIVNGQSLAWRRKEGDIRGPGRHNMSLSYSFNVCMVHLQPHLGWEHMKRHNTNSHNE